MEEINEIKEFLESKNIKNEYVRDIIERYIINHTNKFREYCFKRRFNEKI